MTDQYDSDADLIATGQLDEPEAFQAAELDEDELMDSQRRDKEDEEGAFWAEQAEEASKKKAHNLASSTHQLDRRGIEYIKLSEWHYRVGDYDFWPTTGKFINRKTKEDGRGVFKLLAKLK